MRRLLFLFFALLFLTSCSCDVKNEYPSFSKGFVYSDAIVSQLPYSKTVAVDSLLEELRSNKIQLSLVVNEDFLRVVRDSSLGNLVLSKARIYISTSSGELIEFVWKPIDCSVCNGESPFCTDLRMVFRFGPKLGLSLIEEDEPNDPSVRTVSWKKYEFVDNFDLNDPNRVKKPTYRGHLNDDCCVEMQISDNYCNRDLILQDFKIMAEEIKVVVNHLKEPLPVSLWIALPVGVAVIGGAAVILLRRKKRNT